MIDDQAFDPRVVQMTRWQRDAIHEAIVRLEQIGANYQLRNDLAAIVHTFDQAGSTPADVQRVRDSVRFEQAHAAYNQTYLPAYRAARRSADADQAHTEAHREALEAFAAVLLASSEEVQAA